MTGSSRPFTLDLTTLHPSLGDPALLSMNFLNEVAGRFPDAISFAPGRPTEETFDVQDLHRYLDRFRAHLAEQLGHDETRVRRALFQYGRTKGIIHDLLAQHLAVDEGITAAPESLVVTVGAQEALWLVLRALRADAHDVVLAVAPTYVGLTGAARLLDMPVRFVAEGPDGVDFDDLTGTIRAARAMGERPRALYVVPDFSNPSGTTLSLDARRRLLRLAAHEGLLILEDNPYGLFRAAARRPPTLKALDTTGHVLYVGSLAKSCFPGARVGFAVADQTVTLPSGGSGLFADELSKIKSMVTVNTSAVGQAVVGGMLLEHGGSLVRANERETALYQRNLNALLDGLDARLRSLPGVRWNRPGGGFFVVLSVPFIADDALLEHSAVRHGVLWTPMSHFTTGERARCQLRLSCSYLTEQQIQTGLDRLHALIAERTAARDIPAAARRTEPTGTSARGSE